MKSWNSIVAVLLALVLASCRTPPPSDGSRTTVDTRGQDDLSATELRFAEALARYCHAWILESEGSDGRHFTELERTVRLDPAHTLDLSLALAREYQLLGRNDDAIALMEIARRHHPNDDRAMKLLAYAYQTEQRHAEAAALFDELMTISPDDHVGYVGKAISHIGMSDAVTAFEVLEAGIDRPAATPGVVDELRKLAVLYARAAKPGDARTCIELIRKADPEEFTTGMRIFVIDLGAGRIDEARATAEMLMDSEKGEMLVTESCLVLASQFINLGQIGSALECLRIVEETRATDPGVAIRLFGLYAAAGEDERAESLWREFEGSNEQLARFDHDVGIVYLALRNWERATGAFLSVEQRLAGADEQLRSEILDSSFYYNYGAALHSDGQLPAAQERFERSIDLSPTNAAPLNDLAYLWAEEETELDRALDYAKRALAIDPENAAYVDTLGWIYYKQGKYEQALEQIEKAYKLVPEDPTIAEHLGDVHYALGANVFAVEAWASSFLLNNENESVAAKLRELGIDPGELNEQEEPAPPPPQSGNEAAVPEKGVDPVIQ